MVYGFVKQSGGHIKIYSEEGHGTTMKLYLPRAPDAARPAERRGRRRVEGGNEIILVVEDDALVRSYVVAQLAASAIASLAAANAAEALASSTSERRDRSAVHRRGHAGRDERPPAGRRGARSGGPRSRCCSPRATPRTPSCITAASTPACCCWPSPIARPIWRG